VKRCRSSVGAIPTRQLSLQPVAIGAAVEEANEIAEAFDAKDRKAVPRAGRP
jgi:hypothetical protein